MGLETALLVGGTLLQAGSSIAGGISAQNEANRQSEIALAEADARGREAARVAAREAKLEGEQAEREARRQKVAFLASGVSLAGSPLLIMEETRTRGRENVEEILAGGRASGEAARAEGRLQADQARSSGRQAFMQGISSGVGSLTRLESVF